MTGDYIMSVSSRLLSQLRNEDVVIILSQVLEDRVRGLLLIGRSVDVISQVLVCFQVSSCNLEARKMLRSDSNIIS